MYYYTNRDVPVIRDHAAALKVHEYITPLKSGPNKGIRPVGARRKTYQRIWLTPEGAVKITESWREGYVASEVTYYANGVITVNAPNGTLSHGSLGFVSKILGIEINHRDNRLWIHGVTALYPIRKVWNKEQERITGSFPLLDNNLRLRRDERYPNELVLSNPVFPKVRNINRAGAKHVRNMYRDFILYAKGLYGLRDYAFTREEEAEIDLPVGMEPTEILRLAMSDEPKDNLILAMYLAKTSRGRRAWRYTYLQSQTEENWRENAKLALARFDTVILDAHPEHAYVWQTRYDGKVYMGPLKLSTEKF